MNLNDQRIKQYFFLNPTFFAFTVVISVTTQLPELSKGAALYVFEVYGQLDTNLIYSPD